MDLFKTWRHRTVTPLFAGRNLRKINTIWCRMCISFLICKNRNSCQQIVILVVSLVKNTPSYGRLVTKKHLRLLMYIKKIFIHLNNYIMLKAELMNNTRKKQVKVLQAFISGMLFVSMSRGAWFHFKDSAWCFQGFWIPDLWLSRPPDCQRSRVFDAHNDFCCSPATRAIYFVCPKSRKYHAVSSVY